MAFRVGFRVEGLAFLGFLGFRVQGLVFTILVEVSGPRVKYLMFGVEDSGRIWGSELWFQVLGFRV